MLASLRDRSYVAATRPFQSWTLGSLGADLFLLEGCEARSSCKRAGGQGGFHTGAHGHNCRTRDWGLLAVYNLLLLHSLNV